MTDWDTINEGISECAEMLDFVRDAWASDQLSDDKRLEQLRYFFGKFQWSVQQLAMELDA